MTATKVSIKPLEDRLVVQANEAETTTASGIVIPDTAKEKPQEGTVQVRRRVLPGSVGSRRARDHREVTTPNDPGTPRTRASTCGPGRSRSPGKPHTNR